MWPQPLPVPLTPWTSATAFASARQLTTLVDWRVIADCVADTPGRVSRRALRDATSLPGSTVAQLLLQATGTILRYAQTGGKYQPADLLALTGASQADLVGLTCGTALLLCVGRRNVTAEIVKRLPLAAEAKETLERIRKGEMVFGLLEATQTSSMEASPMICNEQIGGRTVQKAYRFFGYRDRGDC